jgi:hypothetical protein
MNTRGLAKLYDKLTAWERLQLLLAAMNRGDDAEVDRLTRTAPTRPFLVPHYYGLWEGLALVSAVHLLQQLERASRLACATAQLAGGRGVEKEEPLQHLRLHAFRLVHAADAWQLLSAELRIDPEAILRHLPGRDLVRGVEETARKVAFTPEEAAGFLGAEVGTAEEEARGMLDFLKDRAGRY